MLSARMGFRQGSRLPGPCRPVRIWKNRSSGSKASSARATARSAISARECTALAASIGKMPSAMTRLRAGEPAKVIIARTPSGLMDMRFAKTPEETANID